MEGVVVLAIVAVLAIVFASPLLAVVAFVRMRAFARELADVRTELGGLRLRMERLTRPAAAAGPPPMPGPTVSAPGTTVPTPPTGALVPPPVPREATPSLPAPPMPVR